MTGLKLVVMAVVMAFVVVGCKKPAEQDTGNTGTEATELSAELVSTIDGFQVPESVHYAAATGTIYVSNIESKPDEYWSDDSKGHISILGKDNKIATDRWVNSCEACVLHAPKGICQLGDRLYFADNTRLMCCTLEGKDVKVLVSGLTKANDVCTDGKSIWVSDTAAGKVYCVSPRGEKREIKAPESINGVTFAGDKMFGVSWDLHEVFELDPTGEKEPVAFGLADNFTNLDSIEVLDNGTFIVSDFKGNKVCTISADRKTVKTLVEIESPADVGINRKENLLYVPMFMKDKVAVYKLK